MGITKTDFMRGMQCRKMLWLDRHKPGLRVIPPEVQARLDAGNDFGDRRDTFRFHLFRSANGFRDPVHCVVIRKRDRGQPFFLRIAHKLFRGIRAVRFIGMRVKIDR